jgi:hypothetical protein
MPLGRKHLRRSRDAPNSVGMAVQRTTSNLGFAGWEVNLLDDQGLPTVPEDAPDIGKFLYIFRCKLLKNTGIVPQERRV